MKKIIITLFVAAAIAVSCKNEEKQLLGFCAIPPTDIFERNNTKNGYDLKGCGRDWCFKCEKILCKLWEQDSLFLEMNRYHTKDCCKKHSIKNNKNYEKDYCTWK